MAKRDIGLIGLAVMGANLARNIANNGFSVSVYNRSTEKTKAFVGEYGSENLHGEENLESFVESLSLPRKIILMVKAGDPVDMVIDQLTPLLSDGDMLIDCGNSYYEDTLRRVDELKAKGIEFVGCGVSGGEEGALNGPSLMPGGSVKNWEKMKNIWEAIAAKDFEGGPCVTHIGEGGAGHYVKMVHNGIEYGVMQMISEAYDLLRKGFKMDSDEIADIFSEFNTGKLESFLFEISIPVLQKDDDKGEGKLIDKILDSAGQKGTGRWTAIEALKRGVGLSSISEAVFARINSSQKDKRVELSKHFKKAQTGPAADLNFFVSKLEEALYAGMLSSYAQGFELIKQAAEEQHWKIDLSEISRIWQGGCIIRAKVLEFLRRAFENAESQSVHLFELKEIQESLAASDDGWREVVIFSVYAGIPTPCLTSALQYFDAMSSEELPANMIQGLRDYFGAHTYERKDQEGTFHTEW